jgi:GNAT superfamily N-acetyltransferase
MPYILKVSEYSRSNKKHGGFSILTLRILTENQADELLSLQDFAIKEIHQEISELNKIGLTTENPYRPQAFFIVLIYVSEKLVGYGYAWGEDKFTLYIDTIYVLKEYRGKELSYLIIEELIANTIKSNTLITKIKAVTLYNNIPAIRTLKRLGFKYIAPSEQDSIAFPTP